MLIHSQNTVRRSSTSRKPRRGAIVVLIALCLTLILAFVAIAIDGGGLLDLRRQTQATADAAALAAAEDLFWNYPTNKGLDAGGTAVARAVAIAAANGFDNDGTKSIVTVRESPQTYLGGANQGTIIPKGYVEVTVQYNQPRYFSAAIGSGAIPVKARAVARGKWEPAFVGIHVLDPSQKGALNATGTGTASVTGGAKVIVNSDNPEAAITNGGTVTATELDITGGISSTGSGGGFFGGINLGTPPQPDPLRGIPEPDPTMLSDQSHGNTHFSNGSHTLSPGVYHGGITIGGQASATLLPGIYYMDGGGFQMSGQGNLYAAGVMIFNAPKSSSDVITITGSSSGSVYLTPPTTGIYQGLTLFQDRESTNTLTVSGSGNMYVTGTFYAADALMKVSGGGASQIGSQFISRLLEINGNGGLNIDYDPNQAIPRRILGLVE
jgi:putative Flp pilus-assembly TadE/G-like protein